LGRTRKSAGRSEEVVRKKKKKMYEWLCECDGSTTVGLVDLYVGFLLTVYTKESGQIVPQNDPHTTAAGRRLVLE
jgi:hypothetical protein